MLPKNSGNVVVGWVERPFFVTYKKHSYFSVQKFKQKGREEQCEPDDKERAEIVGELLGVDPEAMMKAYCKPKIKVGTEWVTKGQNIEQSTQSVAGIARGLYDRVFRFMVEKCNETLVDPSMKQVNFIGVLDIAGFEIFKVTLKISISATLMKTWSNNWIIIFEPKIM